MSSAVICCTCAVKVAGACALASAACLASMVAVDMASCCWRTPSIFSRWLSEEGLSAESILGQIILSQIRMGPKCSIKEFFNKSNT